MEEAEDALSEANILNNSDPEVWAYLSMVCLKTGRRLEAEQALKYAIKVNNVVLSLSRSVETSHMEILMLRSSGLIFTVITSGELM